MRSRGGEHRALREHIANRLRVKKPVAEAFYECFDRGWHAGVAATLGRDSPQPALEDDPLGHFAYAASRGGTSRLIAERTGQADQPDAGAAPSLKYFLARSLIVAGIVAAVTWVFSDAAGWKLPAVLVAAGVVAFMISIQMATVIENAVMVAIVSVIALLAKSAGFGEVLWPSVFGAIVGAVDGMMQRSKLKNRQL
jgi:hypothetical protein